MLLLASQVADTSYAFLPLMCPPCWYVQLAVDRWAINSSIPLMNLSSDSLGDVSDLRMRGICVAVLVIVLSLMLIVGIRGVGHSLV